MQRELTSRVDRYAPPSRRRPPDPSEHKQPLRGSDGAARAPARRAFSKEPKAPPLPLNAAEAGAAWRVHKTGADAKGAQGAAQSPSQGGRSRVVTTAPPSEGETGRGNRFSSLRTRASDLRESGRLGLSRWAEPAPAADDAGSWASPTLEGNCLTTAREPASSDPAGFRVGQRQRTRHNFIYKSRNAGRPNPARRVPDKTQSSLAGRKKVLGPRAAGRKKDKRDSKGKT